MIYPKFLKTNSTIAMSALSSGAGNKIEELETSIKLLNKQGYKVIETNNVRSNLDPSSSLIERTKQFNDLLTNKDIELICEPTGGDVQFETIDLIDYEAIRNNPRWYIGLSDPTNLLYPITTMLDIATIYGFNGGSFKENDLATNNCLEFLKGNLITQYSYDKYIPFIDYVNDNYNYKDVKWLSNISELKVSGRCIGGCLDVIDKLIGTKIDYTKQFIDKYKNDGIIWYFDNFAMSAFNTYLTLLKFKHAGYLEYTKAIIIGRVAFPSNQDSNVVNDYTKAYKDALGDIPFIYEKDIGHTKPSMTFINGAIMNIDYSNNKGIINFELK